MKLIRLISNDPNGFFETTFNTEIILEPNSKIALQSASFKSALETIDVGLSNRRMTFLLKNSVDGSTENLGIVLDDKFYSDTNYNDLFLDIQKKFNESMGLTKNTIGIDFAVHTGFKNHVQIGYRRSYLVDYEDLELFGFIDNSHLSIASQSLRNTLNVSNANDSSRVISHIPIGDGVKIFRGIPSQDQANTDGCKIGLTQTDNIVGGIIDAEFFIKNNGDGQPYTFLDQKGLVVKTTAFNATCTGANKDILEIAVVGDQIIGSVYRHGQANSDTLFSTAYSQNDFLDLYPFVSIQAKQNDLSIEGVVYTPDMYFFDDPLQSSISSMHENYKLLSRKHNSLVTSLDNFKVGFTAAPVTPRPIDELLEGTLTMARALADYLGIKNKVTVSTEIQDVDEITNVELNVLSVEALKPFKGNIFTKNFIIELNSLNLESYDSEEGRRKNIIASIPKQEQIGVIEYEPNNLYFVNTKNNDTISLRNINCRILNIDGTTPNLDGTSILNFLIDN